MAAGAHPSVSTIRSAIVVRQRFFGIFWPLFLAGSERLRDNRLMTDAAHHQHSESRRPSDRDRIVTTGPSRFHPPSLDQSASAITPWHLYGSGRTAVPHGRCCGPLPHTIIATGQHPRLGVWIALAPMILQEPWRGCHRAQWWALFISSSLAPTYDFDSR